MALFDGVRRPTFSPPNTPPDWAERGEWRGWPPPLDLVVHSRREEIARIAGPHRPEGYSAPVAAGLIRDRWNEDRDAIRVEVGGRPVGYLRREAAAVLAPALDRGRCAIVTVCGVVSRRAGDAAPALYLWPDRRLSDGPEVTLDRGDAAEPGIS